MKAILEIVSLLGVDSGVASFLGHEQVQYEALSYAWGSSASSEYVEVNRHQVLITPTLCSALKHLRRAPGDGMRCLWVDAICIDQSNKAEKSDQVRNMFSIFERARKVIVWLGDATEQTEEAISYLRDYTGDVLIDDDDLVSPLAQGLRDLLLRPWTTRVWVQQEVFAAREVVVRCGEHELRLDEYKHIISVLPRSSSGENVRYHVEALTQLRSSTRSEKATLEAERVRDNSIEHHCGCPSTEKENRIGRQQRPLKSTYPECVLHYSTGLHASDDRDRIFALLGMSNCCIVKGTDHDNSLSSSILHIDYSQSVSEVYQNFTKYIIRRDQSLNILRCHFPNNQTYKGVQLPSWCPDWRSFRGHSGSSYRNRDTFFSHKRFSSISVLDDRNIYGADTLTIRAMFMAELVEVQVDSQAQAGYDRSQLLPLLISPTTHRELLSVLQDRVDMSPSNSHFAWHCIQHGKSTLSRFSKNSDGGERQPEVSISLLRKLRPGDILVQVLHDGWFCVLRQHEQATYRYVGPIDCPQSALYDGNNENGRQWDTFVIR